MQEHSTKMAWVYDAVQGWGEKAHHAETWSISIGGG